MWRRLGAPTSLKMDRFTTTTRQVPFVLEGGAGMRDAGCQLMSTALFCRGDEQAGRQAAAAGCRPIHFSLLSLLLSLPTTPTTPLQVSGESSWERPEGFTGDAQHASSNPVPVKTGACPTLHDSRRSSASELLVCPKGAGESRASLLAACLPAHLLCVSCCPAGAAEKVIGTAWQEVTCDDGKKYW